MNQRPPPTFSYAPPAGPPPSSDYKSRDSKAFFDGKNEPPVRHWPIHSQHVATVTPLRGFIIVFDALLASTPIMFIALALVAARLNEKTVSDYGHKLGQTLLLSPTVFPILFAALMGRCFKHVGLFLAERGTTLGRLEQLVGCQSLFSAIERQIALRSWSIIGLLLTMVWCLSPVGGQSALRLLETESKAVNSVGTYHYLSPLASQDSVLMGASAINTGRSTFTSLFLAALLSSTKYQNTPMDLWGNVKMPLYSSITNSTSSEMQAIPNGDGQNVTYASLIGIPVSGVRSSGYSNYNLRARQWNISCDSNQEMSPNATSFGKLTATWKLNNTDGLCTKYPCNLSLKSIDNSGNFSVASCKMSYEHFEAIIGCNGTICQADEMRKLDLLSDGYTQDYDDFTRSNLLRNMLNILPTVDNYGVADAGARASTNMERWMIDPWSFIGAKYDNVDLYKLPPDVLAERLTILVNTFFQATYATTALGGNLPKNLTELADESPFLTFNSTQADITDVSELIYRTKWRWFAALLVSSIILQIAAYAGLVLKYITLAPDIIGYASSLTLLNPYTPTPTGGTTLHGLERAALLYDMPVKIGDVCAGEPVGAIAMARADLGRVGGLDRRRIYI
ncbi:hypothetical protein K505DRAFT_251467 [Melanomma pulvis-pyrius CBS 109.77]|uniref:Uncharacterized protein n=1 Tax=Melanomma pulvis-pyrius CBS 109.77 TaxID=1314802 RepID=A0A6A6X2E8_9PLEO|nr:hypothetical protein K505DRAFT_251467 [Melanomma pulvis-pyrius CBS 109.77]